MSKEILNKEESNKLIVDTVNEIADTVTLTMGPGGGTVIIVDENGEPYITKDGVSVAKRIWFENQAKDMVAKLFKQVAQNTVEQAGDGTTTSICLAREFITRGKELIKQDKLSYKDVSLQLDLLYEEVLHELTKKAIKLDKKDIVNVATIAANNDKSIGEIIQEAYNHSSLVKVEESNKEKDELVTINGMQIDAPMYERAFINNPSNQSIEYKNIPVLLIDGHFNNIENVVHIIEQYANGIAIIADHFSEELVSIMKQNYNRGALNIALIKSPGFAQHRKDLMSDIATFIDGEVIDINKKHPKMKLGIVDSLKVTYDKTILYKEDITDKPKQLAKDLKESLKDMNPQQKELTQKRIDNLTGKISIIKTGGNSEVEMKERKDRIDDAVLAVSCALEEGIIEGGGKTLFLLNSKFEDNPFGVCLSEPYYTIKERYWYDSTKNLIDEGIIDPVKVTRVALQNAISVAKTILSTESIVLNRLWIH